MFNNGVYMTVELRAKDPGTSEDLARALATLRDESLKEDGCTVFVVHRDPEDAARFLLWERFDDEAAMKFHGGLPHSQAFAALGLVELVQALRTDVLA